MSTIIYKIFSLSVIFAIACVLIPDNRFARVCRFLFSLIFASVIFSAIASCFTGQTPDFPTPDVEMGENAFDEVVREAMKEGWEEGLMQEFSLSADDFTLTLSEVDPTSHLPTFASVILRGRGVFTDTRQMEEYLKEKGGFANVRVSIHLGA